jgi:hypothetical protein
MSRWRYEELKFSDQPEDIHIFIEGNIESCGTAITITIYINIARGVDTANVMWYSKKINMWRSSSFNEEDVNAKYGYLVDKLMQVDSFKDLCLKAASKADGNNYDKIISFHKPWK